MRDRQIPKNKRVTKRSFANALTFHQTLKAIAKYNARKPYEKLFGADAQLWSDKKIYQMEWNIWQPSLARRHEARMARA
jgi:hypothetical protein